MRALACKWSAVLGRPPPAIVSAQKESGFLSLVHPEREPPSGLISVLHGPVLRHGTEEAPGLEQVPALSYAGSRLDQSVMQHVGVMRHLSRLPAVEHLAADGTHDEVL